MATLNTRTIKASGGDYSSIAGWEAGRQGDLVTDDRIEKAEIYADHEDSTQVTFAGWTMDSTRYACLIAPSAERHAGEWDTGKARISFTDGDWWTHNNEYAYIVFEGLQFKITDSRNSYSQACVINVNWFDHSTLIFKKCLFWMNSTAGAGDRPIGMRYNTGSGGYMTSVFINCGAKFTGSSNSPFFIYEQPADNAHRCYVYNLTMRNIMGGIYCGTAYGTYYLKNCGLYNSSFDIASATKVEVCNSTSSPTFASGKEFHLDATDTTWRNRGSGLSNDPQGWPFSDDIESVARPFVWDIGCSENAPANDTARFYFPSSGSVSGVTAPSLSAYWTDQGSLVTYPLATTKTATALTTWNPGVASGYYTGKYQFISEPLGAYSFSAGDLFKMQMLCRASGATNAQKLAISIRVLQGDGPSIRGTLYEGESSVWYNDATLTNTNFGSPHVHLTGSVAAQAGDRLVVEWGTYANQNGSTYMRYGDTGATDLPENTTETSDYVAWFELTTSVAGGPANQEALISTTEYSLPKHANYSSGSPMTDVKSVQALIDVSALAAGDSFAFRLYEKYDAAGSQRLVEEWVLSGAQSRPLLVTPHFLLGAGWDITAKKLAGTDRTLYWRIEETG